MVTVPDTASYIRGWMQMVLTPNDLFSWNNKYSKYTIILLHLYTLRNRFAPHLPAMHITYSVHAGILKLWRGRLPRPLVVFSSSLWITSSLFLCPELTDAPCLCYEGLVPPLPRWRSHPQGRHMLPFQGTRQLHKSSDELFWPNQFIKKSHASVPSS